MKNIKKIIAIILVSVLLFSLTACNNKKKPEKAKDTIAATSDNFEITSSMMEYFANAYYSNWYKQNYYYILLGYISFNPSTPLDEQYTDSSKAQTYYDYFVQGTKTTVETYLKYCEAAKADSTIDFAKLESEAKANTEDMIAQLKEAATQYSDYYYEMFKTKISFSDYIEMNFGKNVTADTLEKAFVIENIATLYYQIVLERTSNSVTSAREDKYFEENLSSFVTAEYLVYTVSSPKTVEFPMAENYIGGAGSVAYREAIEGKTAEQATEIDPSDYEGGAASAAYRRDLAIAENNKKENEESLARDREIVERLASAKTEEEFRSILLAINANPINQTKTASYALTSKLGQALFGGVKAQYGIPYEYNEVVGTSAAKNDVWMWNMLEVNIENYELSIKITEDAIAELVEEIATETDADAKAALEASKKTLEESLEKTKTNLETAKEKLANVETTNEYSYSVYFVTEAAHRDEYKARDVGHILFKVDASKDTDPAVSYKTYEEARAAALYLFEQMREERVDGLITKAKFEEFGKDTHDSNIFYEDVKKGDMIEPFEDWLYSATTVGQTGLVETTYGWHIVYYDGEHERDVWQVTAKEGAIAEDLYAWYESLPTYNIQFKDNVFKDIFNNQSFSPNYTGSNVFIDGNNTENGNFVIILPTNPDNSDHNH